MKRQYRKIEGSVHEAIATYIVSQYPDVIFTSDASGVRLTMGQSVKLKKLRSTHKIPDMLILEANRYWHGLILEIKKSRDEIYKSNGEMRETKHIQKQHKTIMKLIEKGYFATFAYSFDQAKKIIDGYMKRR